MLFEKQKPRSSGYEFSGGYVIAQSENIQFTALHQIMLMTGNELKKRQYHITISAHCSYPASYIGEMCMFFARVCCEVVEGGEIRSDAGKRWLAHQLPIMQTVPVEIGAADFSSILRKAIAADPLKQVYLEEDALQQLELFIDHQRRKAGLADLTH
jgi:hypothetical protein